jgi:hypothetical protein
MFIEPNHVDGIAHESRVIMMNKQFYFSMPVFHFTFPHFYSLGDGLGASFGTMLGNPDEVDFGVVERLAEGNWNGAELGAKEGQLLGLVLITWTRRQRFLWASAWSKTRRARQADAG